MSKENIKKFQEELQTNTELKEKLGDIKLSYENLEDLVSFAKEVGFDFTLEELKEVISKPVVEELSYDELDKVVAGATDPKGNWITTVFFGCDKWEASPRTWLAVKGQCGSCKHWFYKFVLPFCYFGVPGKCLCPR